MESIYVLETFDKSGNYYDIALDLAYPTLGLAEEAVRAIKEISSEEAEGYRFSDNYNWEETIITEIHLHDKVDRDKLRVSLPIL